MVMYWRLYVPASELRDKILCEAHNSPFIMHKVSNKMYQELYPFSWWPMMKRDVLEFLTRCLACQQVKAEHQVPSSLLQPIQIPQWN
ncbi:NBS-LRR resistance-like protein [Gossypium australe]|uniref:NBS-LRR resistance-like protein n=1 Tax=Gossypium australe TaxID=47621 RepID=A0A5B6UY13_9ROSI|nr:NBS-LRR resistance-like protein [Gossypium australe]